MVCTVAILLLTSANVAIHTDAIHLKPLLDDLSKQTGVRLACDPALGSEPLVVDFENVPLDDVLTRIADVIGAQWREKNSVRNLTRTPEFKSKLEREDQQRVIAAWRTLLSEAVKEVDSLPKFSEIEATRMADHNRISEQTNGTGQTELNYTMKANPMSRCAMKLLNAIGVESISRLRTGERVVYSDSPTSVQRLLPRSAKQELEALCHNVSLMQAAKEKLADPHELMGNLPQIGRGETTEYGKTILALRRSGSLRLTFNLIAVDKQGSKIISGQGFLPNTVVTITAPFSGKGPKLEVDPELIALAKLQSQQGVSSASGRPITLPDGTETFSSQWIPFTEVDGEAQDRGMGKFLSDPVAYDPMGHVFGKLIRQVAKQEKLPLLASVPDSCLLFLSQSVAFSRLKTQGDLEEYLQQTHIPASNRMPYAELKRDSWLVVKPWFPSIAINERFNREAARTMIASIRKRGTASVDDGVLYKTKAPSLKASPTIDTLLLSFANPNVDRSGVESVLVPASDFFAAIGPGAWQSFVGQSVTYGNMPPKLRDLVDQWVYWSGTQSSRAEIRFMPGDKGAPGPLQLEPTEFLPNGIPGEAPIRISVTEIPAVIARASSSHTFNLSLYSLADFEDSGGSLTFAPEGFKKRTYEMFVPAVQRLYTITVTLPGNRKETRTAIETLPLPGATAVKRDMLPESYLKGIVDAKEFLKKPKSYRPPRSG